MARIPFGADLIPNAISKAPGFRIGNVMVMAGVPAIMQAMLDAVGRPCRAARRCNPSPSRPGAHPEGNYAGDLGALAKNHAAVSIGSYPMMTPEVSATVSSPAAGTRRRWLRPSRRSRGLVARLSA